MLRFLTAGESHGPSLTAILDGMPAGLPITPDIIDKLDKLTPLAPLHQPNNLAPIRILAQSRPELPQIACFDTAFHRAQPELAQAFSLPASITWRPTAP